MSSGGAPVGILVVAVIAVVIRVIDDHLKRREFHHSVRRQSIAMTLERTHSGDVEAQGHLAHKLVTEPDCSTKERARLRKAAIEALQANWLSMGREQAEAFVDGDSLCAKTSLSQAST